MTASIAFEWLPTGTALRRLRAGLVWLLAAAAGAHAGAAGERVFAVARLPLSLPVYVAEAKGYFNDEQLALRVVDCDIGRECLDWLLGGKADLATSAESPIVLASLRGERFSVIATIAESRNYSKIVSRRDNGVGGAADLAGKRVGTFVGSSAQYFLDLKLLSSGVDPSQVALVPLQPAQTTQALASGRVDAVAVFEPYASHAATALGKDAVVLGDRGLRSETWNIVARRTRADERDAALEGLCRALDRAARFIAREPLEAHAILSDRLGLDAETVQRVWRDIQYGVTLRQSLVTGLEGQARWALRNGHASGTPPNYLGYIWSGPLKQVRPRAATIVE